MSNGGKPGSIAGTILVATLGYFVDVYDLIIFSVVRVASLKDLGIAGPDLLSVGVHLINIQMAGMLVGGILWGVWGDKRGRVSVLLGSIFLYSAANILNGFVTSVEQYAILRFIAGLGLAGELGAGITLVSEIMPKETRGYGTTIIATIGVAGAVAAAIAGSVLDWRNAYILGGVLGLLLLLLRVSVQESSTFESVARSTASRGNLLMLLRPPARLISFLSVILVSVPIWYAVGVLVTFAPEFAIALGATAPVTSGSAVLYCYTGLVCGDLISGLLSQWMKSRRKVILLFILLTLLSILIFLNSYGATPAYLYGVYFMMGTSIGYWALSVSSAAEQFGTNLRATVTTSVPNFVRGAVIPVTSLFQYVKADYGIITSAFVVGLLCTVVALLSLSRMRESFGRDLDFIEE